jgi:acyl carrier protein
LLADLDAPKVEAIIIAALETLNEELDDDEKVEVGPNTALFGVDAEIDSLSLVSVIVDVETELNVEHELEASLTDDRAMSREISPFTDVQALKDYILELVEEQRAA